LANANIYYEYDFATWLCMVYSSFWADTYICIQLYMYSTTIMYKNNSADVKVLML